MDDKLIGKFWDTITQGGIGNLASPWQTKRQGRANVDVKVDEMLMLAQAEKDVQDIKSGNKKFTKDRKLVNNTINTLEPSNDRIEPYFNLENIIEASESRVALDLVQEQINLTKTILYTEHELENNNQEGSEQEVDQDWFTRWRSCAEKVSSEELQKLWAKALAGEIIAPGSYSLRTLEFIKNISLEEANDIDKLAPYAIDNMVHKVDFLAEEGLDFNYLLGMEELGIINGVQARGVQSPIGSIREGYFERVMVHNRKILLIKHDRVDKELKYYFYKVTRLGREVLSLGVFPINEAYLEQIGFAIKNQGFQVSLGDFEQENEENGRYYNMRIL